MTDADLIALVERLRAKQREYFRTRTSQALQESKDLEQRVNRAIAERKATPSMFDAPGGES
jgi:hypothetical protein